MAFPTISVDDREIVLLSGFTFVDQNLVHDKSKSEHKSKSERAVIILDEGNLVRSVKNNNDAVAYGYVEGQWIAAA